MLFFTCDATADCGITRDGEVIFSTVCRFIDYATTATTAAAAAAAAAAVACCKEFFFHINQNMRKEQM